MKYIMGAYLLLKVLLFLFCLIISIPLIPINPAYFANGVDNFVDRWIDDLFKYGLINKDEYKELKDDFYRG